MQKVPLSIELHPGLMDQHNSPPSVKSIASRPAVTRGGGSAAHVGSGWCLMFEGGMKLAENR